MSTRRLQLAKAAETSQDTLEDSFAIATPNQPATRQNATWPWRIPKGCRVLRLRRGRHDHSRDREDYPEITHSLGAGVAQLQGPTHSNHIVGDQHIDIIRLD